VIVTTVHRETIKVKTGKSKKAKTRSDTALEIEFSGLVAGAGDLAAYQLSSVTSEKVKKKAVTTYKPIKLASAIPGSSPTASVVLLVPATRSNLGQTDRLEIVAADLTDMLGRPLDGNDDGQPGGNFAAAFGKQGIAFPLPSVSRDRADGAPVPSGRRESDAEIIDALLERGELADVKQPRDPRSADD
jgi:hypothetical protein